MAIKPPPESTQWKKGESGNPSGRPAVKKIRAAIRHLSPKAMAALESAIDNGESWGVTLWFHYFYGKPKERHELSGPDGQSLTIEIRKLSNPEGDDP